MNNLTDIIIIFLKERKAELEKEGFVPTIEMLIESLENTKK